MTSGILNTPRAMSFLRLRNRLLSHPLARLLARLLAIERRTFLRLRSLADRRLATRAHRRGERPTPQHLLTGERGEDHAFFHLRSLGYTVVARRWRTERMPGDLDLVAWDGPTLVIFEVKTRTASSKEQVFAPAETSVDAHKQQTLRKMASAYLRQFPAPTRTSIAVRFDILSVYQLPAGIEFEQILNAFPLAEPVGNRRG